MNKFAFAVLACVLGALLAAAFFVIRDLQANARQLCAMQDVKRLGVIAEWYRNDQDDYPASLKVVESSAPPEQRKELAALRGHLDETCHYRRLPNGFTITVHGRCCRYECVTNGYNVVVGRETNHITVSVQSLPTTGSSQ
jgi:hypothetical protein